MQGHLRPPSCWCLLSLREMFILKGNFFPTSFFVKVSAFGLKCCEWLMYIIRWKCWCSAFAATAIGRCAGAIGTSILFAVFVGTSVGTSVGTTLVVCLSLSEFSFVRSIWNCIGSHRSDGGLYFLCLISLFRLMTTAASVVGAEHCPSIGVAKCSAFYLQTSSTLWEVDWLIFGSAKIMSCAMCAILFIWAEHLLNSYVEIFYLGQKNYWTLNGNSIVSANKFWISDLVQHIQ